LGKKYPWFRAWAKDILADTELKSVPIAAKGFWLDLMCLMHLSPRRGFLLQENGQPFSLETLAKISGISTEEADHLLQCLVNSAALSVSDDEPRVPYSRRMAREARLGEVRAGAGSKGGRKRVKNLLEQNSSKGPSKPSSKPLGSDYSSLSEEKEESIHTPLEGGLGGFAQANLKQTIARLAQKAALLRGRRNDRKEIERWEAHLAELFKAGLVEAAIDAELDSSERSRTETAWDFEKRMKPMSSRKSKSAMTEAIRASAEWAKNGETDGNAG
jgi:hypothetical protein